MASSSSPPPSSFPDIFSWLQNITPLLPCNTTTIDLCHPSLHPYLNLSINNSYFTLSITVDCKPAITLWTSKGISVNPKFQTSFMDHGNTLVTLLMNIIEDVLKYTPNKCPSSFKAIPRALENMNHDDNNNNNNIKDIFNFSFLSLVFIICIYEAPNDLRGPCLKALIDQFACTKSRRASKALMRLVGSNIEEQWMRSMNLAITNYISELQAANVALKTPSTLFSYSFSTVGLWKVQLYCPIIAMEVEKSSNPSPDECLMFSLNYHQLEGVIQLNYSIDIQENWIEVMINTDNIRCDVIKLLTEAQLKQGGAGASEKHFPSRISLQLTPTADVITVSVSKSTQNPPREIGVEKAIEAAFDPPSGLGLHISAGETVTSTLRPWKFEQSVYGSTATLNWFLHDAGDGREVFSSKPSKMALLHPKAWFKNRYSSAGRPFTRQGGVVFAGDEYGEGVRWRVGKGKGKGKGKGMEWELKGWIWLTYWPNKERTFYAETRRLEFKEVLQLNMEEDGVEENWDEGF